MALGGPGQVVVKAIHEKSKDEAKIRTINSLAEGGVIELRANKEQGSKTPADYKLTARGQEEFTRYHGSKAERDALAERKAAERKASQPDSEKSSEQPEPVAA